MDPVVIGALFCIIALVVIWGVLRGERVGEVQGRLHALDAFSGPVTLRVKRDVGRDAGAPNVHLHVRVPNALVVVPMAADEARDLAVLLEQAAGPQ